MTKRETWKKNKAPRPVSCFSHHTTPPWHSPERSWHCPPQRMVWHCLPRSSWRAKTAGPCHSDSPKRSAQNTKHLLFFFLWAGDLEATGASLNLHPGSFPPPVATFQPHLSQAPLFGLSFPVKTSRYSDCVWFFRRSSIFVLNNQIFEMQKRQTTTELIWMKTVLPIGFINNYYHHY